MYKWYELVHVDVNKTDIRPYFFARLRFPGPGVFVILWLPLAAAARTSAFSPMTSRQETNMAAPSKSTVVLKAVKKIVVQFCPFETNVRSTRWVTRV